MILLVGSSSGIGNKLLQYLLKFDDVFATYYKKKIKYSQKKKGNKLFIRKLDISKEKNIKNFILKNQKILKKVTFVNLATISIDKLVPNIGLKDIRKVFNINTFSNILFTKYLLKIMLKENYGRFIFITSTRASNGDIGLALYSSSKSSLRSLSKCLSKEYGRYNITSNVISLGYFNSPLLDNINTKLKQKLIDTVPSKKTGKVINISNTIKNIIKSNYINGSEIKIDGGI